jgi:tRNA(fMet)-specific endonuclease VapC
MKFLLDSNVIVAALLGDNNMLRDKMAECGDGELVTSSIAFAEVAYGSVNGRPPSFDRLERFAQKVAVLPFDYSAARAYATLAFKRASYDRLIAAHALSLDLIVVTHNEKHFADVPGLKVENWTV